MSKATEKWNERHAEETKYYIRSMDGWGNASGIEIGGIEKDGNFREVNKRRYAISAINVCGMGDDQ